MDSSTTTTVRGVYVPSPTKGGIAKFKPLNPADYSTKIQSPTQGTVVPEAQGFQQPHGTLIPSAVPTSFSDFIPDPEGSVPASFYSDNAAATPVLGLVKLVLTPGAPSDFQPYSPATTVQTDMHGKLISKTPGAVPLSGILKYKSSSVTTQTTTVTTVTTFQWEFIQGKIIMLFINFIHETFLKTEVNFNFHRSTWKRSSHFL